MVEIKLCIEDPFENDFIEDRFKDFFDRVISDIKASNYEGLCGNYELETACYLRDVFEHVINNNIKKSVDTSLR